MSSIIHRGKPLADFMDEIISSRGNQADLQTRLGNGMNADGTLKTPMKVFLSQSIAATLSLGTVGFTPQYMIAFATDLNGSMSFGFASGTGITDQISHEKGNSNFGSIRSTEGNFLNSAGNSTQWSVTQFDATDIVIDRGVGSETASNVHIIVFGQQ